MAKDYEGFDKETTPKYISSKYEMDLYDEDNAKPSKSIRIKRILVGGEKWRFFDGSKNTLTVLADELNENEVKFLRTAEGVLFCLNKYKQGITSLDGIKKNLSEKVAGLST
ncbi:MAG: hypothetical protein LC122_13385 [Chitinophagales bacterium]|nr:hypothetical protein [Chitinophagales bacterium]